MNSSQSPEYDITKIDKENTFLLYATFCGDSLRTAHALDVPESLIKQIAVENEWDRRLKPLIDLKNSSKPGDVERAINRAVNFVEAHKYRLFLNVVLRQLTGMTTDDLRDYIFSTGEDKEGNVYRKFSTRALADLASAMEKCQNMTYIALNDTATERRERGDTGEDSGGASAAEMHVRLAEAMSKGGGPSKSIKGLVLDAQLALAQDHANVELRPDKIVTV